MERHRAPLCRLPATAVILVTAALAYAQNPPPAETSPSPRSASPPVGETVINLPSDRTLERRELQFLVTHRTHEPLRGSDARTLYSTASQSVGLSLAYAPIRDAQVSLSWSEIWADYELALKFALHPFGAGAPFRGAFRIGGNDRRDAFSLDENGVYTELRKAQASWFAQLVLTTHLLGERLEVCAVPSYASLTTTERRVFNVPFHADAALSKTWNLQFEYVPRRPRLRGSVAQWAVAIEKVVPGHRFSLVVANSTVTAVDQYLSSDFLAAAKRSRTRTRFRNNDPYLGLNLVRQFRIGR